MGGMGLIFTPVLVRCLLGPPGLGPMISTSWTHSYVDVSNTPIGRYTGNSPPASYPPIPTTHSPTNAPPPPSHPLIRAIRDITVASCEKSCSKFSSVSYLL